MASTLARRLSMMVVAAVAVPAVAAGVPSDQDAPYQAGSPWPVMRHDRRNTGRSPIPAAYHGDRPWAFRTGKGIFSSPIVGRDGTVYVGSADAYFYAIGADGRLRWRFRTGNVIDSAAVIGRYDPASRTSPITFGSGDEFLYHIRSDRRRMSRNRRLLWKLEATQPPGSGQLVDWWEGNAELGPDGTIYAGNTGDAAYAVNPDGTVKWVYRSTGSFWTDAAIADDGTTYWGSLDLAVHAIDAGGNPLWSRGTLGFVVSSPALATDGTLYVGSFDRRLYALDAASGRTRWSFATSDHVYSSPALDEDADGHVTAVYFASTDGSVYALDPSGHLRWHHETGDPVRSSPVLGLARGEHRNVVYVGSANGRLYAINADDGTRRWSYDTTSHHPALRDRNDLNSSPALGRHGIYVGSEDGHLYYVPYDYCLHARSPRCDTAPGEAFPDDLTAVFPVTAGGSTERERVRAPAALATVLNTRLVVRQGGRTVDAAIDALPPASGLVTVHPPFDFSAALSGDGRFLFVLPDGFLEPDTAYTVGVAGTYAARPLPGGGMPPGGGFSDAIRFHTTRAHGALPLRTGSVRVSAFRLRRLAIPMPAFVPSVNQIGFDSYDLIVGTLAKSAPDTRGEGSILLWVVGARRDRHGRWVADPDGNLAFPLAGRYRDDSLLLSAHALTLIFSFGPIPLERLDLRMQLGRSLRATPGASLYAEVVCLNVPYYGPLLPLARLCNPDGNLIGSGTYLTQPYPPAGAANARPPGLRVSAVALERPTTEQAGSVQATLAIDGDAAYPAREHLVSILLADADTGAPVILDYRNGTALTGDAAGNVAGVRVDIPAGVVLPERVRAYVITDVFPLHEEVLP